MCPFVLEKLPRRFPPRSFGTGLGHRFTPSLQGSPGKHICSVFSLCHGRNSPPAKRKSLHKPLNHWVMSRMTHRKCMRWERQAQWVHRREGEGSFSVGTLVVQGMCGRWLKGRGWQHPWERLRLCRGFHRCPWELPLATASYLLTAPALRQQRYAELVRQEFCKTACIRTLQK